MYWLIPIMPLSCSFLCLDKGGRQQGKAQFGKANHGADQAHCRNCAIAGL